MFRIGTYAAVMCSLCLAFTNASAQTLYKLVDKAGKITYSETPPSDFDGKVIRIDIDPQANTVTLPKPPVERAAPLKAGPEEPKGIKALRVAAARRNLENARKALDDARSNADPEKDFMIVQVGGGGGGRRGGMHGMGAASGASGAPGAVTGGASGGTSGDRNTGSTPKDGGRPVNPAGVSSAPRGGIHGTPPDSGTSTRRIPTDAYLARLAALEEAVRQAEADLEKAEAAS